MSGKRSKRYNASMASRPVDKVPIKDAIAALKTFGTGKFDQTVELSVEPGQAVKLKLKATKVHDVGRPRRISSASLVTRGPEVLAGAVGGADASLVSRL